MQPSAGSPGSASQRQWCQPGGNQVRGSGGRCSVQWTSTFTWRNSAETKSEGYGGRGGSVGWFQFPTFRSLVHWLWCFLSSHHICHTFRVKITVFQCLFRGLLFMRMLHLRLHRLVRARSEVSPPSQRKVRAGRGPKVPSVSRFCFPWDITLVHVWDPILISATQLAGGETYRKQRAVSFLISRWEHHTCRHVIGQHLVTWPQLTAKEPGECSLQLRGDY